MPDEPLLPCEMCGERATVVILCADGSGDPAAFVHAVRCSDHPQETCEECRIIGVTVVVAGG